MERMTRRKKKRKHRKKKEKKVSGEEQRGQRGVTCPIRGQACIFLFFQVDFAVKSWNVILSRNILNKSAFLKMIIKSRVDLAAKKYLLEIRRFRVWFQED